MAGERIRFVYAGNWWRSHKLTSTAAFEEIQIIPVGGPVSLVMPIGISNNLHHLAIQHYFSFEIGRANAFTTPRRVRASVWVKAPRDSATRKLRAMVARICGGKK